MATTPQTYGEAHEKAVRLMSQARLADPNEHFPYKIDEVLDLIDTDPPMGPGIPGQVNGADDTSRTVADYMTPGIAQASAEYVDAQAAYLESPSDTTRQAYDAARDRLVAARLDHRSNRDAGFTIGAAARRAG
jgi:hypothetical protein